MPRKARIVTIGALHHIRIKRKANFKDIADRKLEKFKNKYRAINFWICCLKEAGFQNEEIERTSFLFSVPPFFAHQLASFDKFRFLSKLR